MNNTSSITDVFYAIARLSANLKLFPTQSNTIERIQQNSNASFNFLQYVYQKSLCIQLRQISTLKKYEYNILKIIVNGQLIPNNEGIDLLSENIGAIQMLLLEQLPPESKEYQELLNDIPSIKKYTPSTE